VGIVSLDPAEEILTGIGDAEFDVEGRTITMVTSKVILISAYFPNSQDKGKRVDYKIRFCKKIHKWAQELRTKYKRPLILCGDYNIAHEEIDLARPDSNHETAGFLPQEREWMGEFLDSGWVDSFRSLHPNEQRYSWWSARMKARERNVGWRIDYHCLPKEDASLILEADIQDQVMGSDHCPVTLKLKV
jgi:exodeoxyribonuclease-3